jgi:hypothetical protein
MYSLAREVRGLWSRRTKFGCVHKGGLHFSYIPPPQFCSPHHFRVARWFCFENKEKREKCYLHISNDNIVQYENEEDGWFPSKGTCGLKTVI